MERFTSLLETMFSLLCLPCLSLFRCVSSLLFCHLFSAFICPFFCCLSLLLRFFIFFSFLLSCFPVCPDVQAANWTGIARESANSIAGRNISQFAKWYRMDRKKQHKTSSIGNVPKWVDNKFSLYKFLATERLEKWGLIAWYTMIRCQRKNRKN